MIKKLRSMATIPKCILLVGIVGSTWFFGQQVWFYISGDVEWEWVFTTTFIVAFMCSWLLFGSKGKKLDSGNSVSVSVGIRLLDRSQIVTNHIRSLPSLPKWILLVSIAVPTWFFGQEVWFQFASDVAWEWVFTTTFIVAFLCYWLLFDSKGKKLDSGNSVSVSVGIRLWIVLSVIWYAAWSYSFFLAGYIDNGLLNILVTIWMPLVPLVAYFILKWIIPKLRLLRTIRSLPTIPKWILCVGIVVSTWVFGQVNWFYTVYSHGNWEWVFITTFIVTFLSYWLLFGLKGNKIDSDK